MTDQEKNVSKKKRGRPATGHGKTVGVRIHDQDLILIDAARRNEGGITRPELIRLALAEWLKTKGYEAGEEGQ